MYQTPSSLSPYTRLLTEVAYFMTPSLQSKLQMYTEIKMKQGNQGDMRKIHVIRQFFEAYAPHGHFFEKTKNMFLDIV